MQGIRWADRRNCPINKKAKSTINKKAKGTINLHLCVAEFPRLKPDTRKTGVCPQDCVVCLEGNRRGFQPTLGAKRKRGRPSIEPKEDRSPVGMICNKCGEGVTNRLIHKCVSKAKAAENYKERLENKQNSRTCGRRDCEEQKYTE